MTPDPNRASVDMSEPTPRPYFHRADLPVVAVEHSLVVFDPQRERAHLLNHSAAAVWWRFEVPEPVDVVVTDLAERYGLDVGDLRDEVRGVVDELVSIGLLHDANDDLAASGDAASPPASSADPGFHHRHDWAVVTSRHRALEVSFRTEVVDAPIGAYVERVVAPLESPADPSAPLDGERSWTYRVWATADDPDRFVVSTEHATLAANASRADAIGTLLWHYNHEAIEHTTRLLLLHSSAVATDEGALALPAVANSGKSTLATALVRAGYRYITDEALALDPDTLRIEPYPKPIGLDPGSFPLFPDLEPTEDELPPELFHHKWWLDPRRISPLGADAIAPASLPLLAIVFPTYVADAEPTLEPVEPAEGVILLARNAFNLKRWGQRGLDLLAEIATTVPLYRMTHNDLATSLDLLAGVIGPPPQLGEDGDH